MGKWVAWTQSEACLHWTKKAWFLLVTRGGWEIVIPFNASDEHRLQVIFT